jgi:large subunit ribosomal protein L25
MDNMKLMARTRDERGSAASRRLRRAGEVPGILSGLGEEAVPLAVGNHELDKVLRSSAQLVTLALGSDEVEALIREVQWDAMGEKLLHVDFDRVRRGQTLELEIPLAFFGEPAGAAEGAIFQTHLTGLSVECLPSAIPESIEINVTALETGDEIRAGGIELPEGVVLASGFDPETLIATLSARAVEEEEEDEGEDGDADEPEVLTEKKEEL